MQTFPLISDAPSLLLILLGAIFVHACFQLSLSVLTLLSSHTIGRRLTNGRLLSLSFWYILGVGVMTTLLVIGAVSVERFMMSQNAWIATVVPLSILPLIALLMVLFYYRRGKGTRLWLPRPAAEYITSRAKKTKSSVEAFGLGLTTAITELPFAIAPIALVAYTFEGFASDKWLAISAGYGIAITAPLVFVSFYLSSGHKISSVQRWREEAKRFLNWASAVALLLLTLFVLVLQMGAGQ
jgi:hypothetical protein